MSVVAPVAPELIVWARSRSRRPYDDLAAKFKSLGEWESGRKSPTLAQLESFAKATHTPVGFFFLQKPPEEPLPIEDFRTIPSGGIEPPSPDLLDSIYDCQRRQDWYRNFARDNDLPLASFVGTMEPTDDVVVSAKIMRDALHFGAEDRRQFSTWTDALRELRRHAEAIGCLVMINGVVGNNTHRPLDPEEFRGFALVDDRAPLVFVNGADTKAAQIFTLAHELAHVWLGASALSEASMTINPTSTVERWCNAVAAEFLVPLAHITPLYDPSGEVTDELERLARVYKVSTLVILRRLHDAGFMTFGTFLEEYRRERDRVMQILARRQSGDGGGDFYLLERVRVGDRFARALVSQTLEGQTLRRDALSLLGFKKSETFERLGRELGVA